MPLDLPLLILYCIRARPSETVSERSDNRYLTVRPREALPLMTVERHRTRLPGPGFIPVDHCVKAVVSGTFRAQQYCIDLWFHHYTGAPTLADMAALASGINLNFTLNYVTFVSSDLLLNRIYLRDYTTQNGLQYDFGTSDVPGEQGDAMPNNVAACISFRTGISGRSFRGRNYIGAVPRADVTENTISSAFRVAAQACYQAMVGVDVVAPGWLWGVVSFKSAGAWRTSGVFTPIETVLFTDSIVDDMDKRLPGRGR